MPNDNEQAVADASDFGWKPGYWPIALEHHGETYARELATLDPDGDLLAYRYVAPSGRVIVVVND